jgi:hypothetical protein
MPKRARSCALAVLHLGQALLADSDRDAARAITDGVMACAAATSQRRVRTAIATMLRRW